ncbi:MAG: ABC transporter permease [Chloroflexota bacterium]|nr:MAG: ABC transporter permease [Chloroflexota bacterium]
MFGRYSRPLLLLRLISIQVRSQLQYRIPFLFDIFAAGTVTFLGFLSLAFVFQRFGAIAGWSLPEVAFLYGMVEASFGVMDMIFSGFDPGNFGRQVRLGRFDQVLLRPVGVTLQIFGSEFIMRRLGRAIQGMVILVFAISLVDIHWTAAKLLYLPVVFASLVIFFGGIFITGATITFWTVESIELINILSYGGAEMMSYPMHIYEDWMRRFFTYIIPAIFIIYYPALYILDKPDPLHMPPYAPFLSPLAGLIVFLAALLFWNFGVRHYQSTGT